jgi:hypothetical protein
MTNPWGGPRSGRELTHEQAKEKCDAAEECDYAKDGLCTLAEVNEFCALYKQWLLDNPN